VNVPVRIFRTQILSWIQAHLARSGLTIICNDSVLNQLPVLIEIEANQRDLASPPPVPAQPSDDIPLTEAQLELLRHMPEEMPTCLGGCPESPEPK